mgnify:CR=1 FL=1
MKKANLPQEMPSSEELKGELKRIGFKKQYKDIIKSTFFSLVAVAAVAVMAAVAAAVRSFIQTIVFSWS